MWESRTSNLSMDEALKGGGQGKMSAQDWERCCFWRAVEGTDDKEHYLSDAVSIEATQASKGALDSQAVDPQAFGSEVAAFLARRARRLDDLAASSSRAGLVPLLEKARLPRLPGGLLGLGGVLAAGLGFWMTSLGSERELNLLALPLVGLLLWNAVIIAAALVLEFWKPGQSFSWNRKTAVQAEPEAAKVLAAFRTLTEDCGQRLLARRLRAWLHVAAALVALGSMAALFARGWSREYRAVWESTILDTRTAEGFLGGLFAPAAAVFGPEVPLQEVAGMRRGEGLKTVPANALPWLKLYAGTLALGVVLPRLGLALLTLLRGRQDLRRAMAAQGWAGYALRLLRRVEGSGSAVRVVVAGGAPDEKVRERWRRWLGSVYGGRCEFEMEAVSEADQDDWVAEWQPQDGRLVVIFFLAATPEDEVQRAWLEQVREGLLKAHYEPEVVVLLDAAGLATRWSVEKRGSREQLWREAVSGLAAQAWVGDEGGLQELRGDTPQKPL